MKLIAIISTVALLAGCATTSLDAGKGLAIAWQSLDAASVAADAAVKSGKLSGQKAATVAADIRKAQSALQVATAAYSASGTDPAANVAIATTALAEVVALVGSK